MSTPEDLGLELRQRELIDAALIADPALADELELIDGFLDAAVRGDFWRGFAQGCAAGGRPAAAVLAALERAAAAEARR